MKKLERLKLEVLGLGCEVREVSDLAAIAERGVLLTPALLVDGVVKCSGKVPQVDDVIRWLGEE